MIAGRAVSMDKYLLGGSLLLAIVLGGNSAPSFWVDQLIQLALLAASAVVLWRNTHRPSDPRLVWMIIAITAAVIFQLVPLPAHVADLMQNIVSRVDPEIATPPSIRPLTLGIGRTLESLSWVLCCGLFTLATTKLDFEQAHALVPIFLIGVLFHLVAGLMQYSANSRPIGVFLGYELGAGLFANSNHFSTLIFISIPLAFAFFYDYRRLSFFLVYLAVTMLILLAVGSRAGVMIGLAITLLSGLILLRRNVVSTLAVLAGAVIAGIFALGVWVRLSDEGLENTARTDFARTTLDGILDNLPFGIGYGGFVNAYPAFERTERIFSIYVNHAHNDFLELMFEGGVIAALLLAAAIVLIIIRTAETYRWPLHFASSLAIIFVLVHSVVDYPLRTMAISASFCLLIAILFHKGGKMNPPAAGEREKRRTVQEKSRARKRRRSGGQLIRS